VIFSRTGFQPVQRLTHENASGTEVEVFADRPEAGPTGAWGVAYSPLMSADAEKILSAEYVRKVAALSRLALTDAQVAQYRGQLSGVLGYVQRLRELNLDGVEPLANVGGETNRLDDDVPGPTLSNEALMKIAPESMPPFVKVPKVLGDGGGA
jgi:aspartyl-tRNA(Asn)/glutamyl-tRNA(Gln) amidotransferase subunit C